MRIRSLSVTGAKLVTPEIHRDSRGHFATPFDAHVAGFAFPVAQVSVSQSHRGAVRGIHFTSTPPGCAKIVWCSSGRAVDFVVDLRRGSPTFGVVDRVELDAQTGATVVLPVGVGHGYQATADDVVITYLLSNGYVAANEQALSVADPDLGLDLPMPELRLLSDRDRNAPTLTEWIDRGGLPDYAVTAGIDLELAGAFRHQLATAEARVSASGGGQRERFHHLGE